METLLPLMVGTLFAVGLYFILHRHLFKVILGLILFGLATNLFLFVIGGLPRAATPTFKKGQRGPTNPTPNPWRKGLR